MSRRRRKSRKKMMRRRKSGSCRRHWHHSSVTVNRGHIAQSDGVVSWLFQLLSLSVRRTASAQK